MKKIVMLLTIVIIILSGCKNTDIDMNDLKSNGITVVDDQNTGDTNVIENLDISEDGSQGTDGEDITVMDGFNALLDQTSLAGDLGNYITVHFTETTIEELETMIEWLIIYQSEDMDNMNQIIYDDPYFNALNVDMGGVLDPEKVQNIQDFTVRKDFQNMVDGYMTIVRYEETPVIETDWAALEILVPNVSENFGTMMTLFSKIQNFNYGTRDFDFNALAMDAISVENLISYEEPTFLSWQLNLLYNRQISNLLIGPEGTYMDTFINKSGQLYDILMKVAYIYPESKLGQLITQLDQSETTDYADISTIINSYKQFGLGSDNYLTYTKAGNESDQSNKVLIQIVMPEATNIEAQINNTIMDTVDHMKADIADNITYSLYMYSEFSNQQFLSIGFYLSYNDSGENYVDKQGYLNFDLMDGRLLTLEDYLGLPFDELKIELLSITEISFIEMPDFSISNMGINLYGADNIYANVTLKELVPYISPSNYYK